MASPSQPSLRFLQMLDPLQFEGVQLTEGDSSGHSQTDEEQGHEPSPPQLDRTSAVTTDGVKGDGSGHSQTDEEQGHELPPSQLDITSAVTRWSIDEVKGDSSGHSQTDEEQGHELSPSQLDRTSAVTHWSTDDAKGDNLGHSQADEEQEHESSLSQLDIISAVTRWSTDEVRTWLQQNVSVGSERMEECLLAFQNEGVDGLRLLTLQRNDHACLGMTDSEWHLLNAARTRLLAGEDSLKLDPKSHLITSLFTLPITLGNKVLAATLPSLHQPFRLQTSSSMPLRPAQESRFLSSSMRLLSFPKLWWTSSTGKDEQNESLVTEVHSLQGEIVSAEEREATLKAEMDHLDEILRTAQLASYLYTRMRWTLLPGELPVDDTDVDDWLQRFLVLQGSTIFFYPRAADLRPQGAILLSEIVDTGPIPGRVHHQQDNARPIPGRVHHQQDNTDWFAFHITTCDGLRLECLTPYKLQMELWLTLIGVDHETGGSSQQSH